MVQISPKTERNQPAESFLKALAGIKSAQVQEIKTISTLTAINVSLPPSG